MYGARFPWLQKPDQAVNREARMPPGENALRPVGAEEVPVNQRALDFAGKDLRQPLAEGLDGRDPPGRKRAPDHDLISVLAVLMRGRKF